MDSEGSLEGSYDAPLEQLPSASAFSEASGSSALAADRQARIDRVRQRRTEMSQNPSSLRSALNQTTTPNPITIKESGTLPSALTATSLRSELVQDAIDFLNNPRVASAPLATKKRFLTQRKGLTEAEVEEAVRRSTPASASSVAAAASINNQLQTMTPPPPPQYYAAPMVYPPPQQVVAYPSLKSIAFVVVVCVGIASGLVHLFRKYIWSYWFPKKSKVDEKIDLLEKRVSAAQELMTVQAGETREAIGVLRGFLENQLTDWSERQRLERLQQEQDEKGLSELKREVSSVRHLIPSVGNFARSVKASALQTDVMEEIRNELNSLKNAVKGLVAGNPTSSLNPSRRASSSANLTSLATESVPEVPTQPQQIAEVPEILNSSTASTPNTASPASQLKSSAGQSRRPMPAWMQAQTNALPAWQMEAKSEQSSTAPIAANPEVTTSSAPDSTTSTPIAEQATTESSAPMGTVQS